MKRSVSVTASLLAACVLACCVGAAGAASADEPASGLRHEFYVGVHLGYGNVDLGGGPVEPEGFAGGAEAGVSLWYGRLFAGAELDITGGALSDSVTELAAPGNPVTFGLDLEYLASVRGRLGVALTDALTLYGTAGYAWSDAKVSISIPLISFKATETVGYEGFVYGGGLSYDVTTNAALRLEALRYDLGADTAGNSDIQVDVIRFGADYRFR